MFYCIKLGTLYQIRLRRSSKESQGREQYQEVDRHFPSGAKSYHGLFQSSSYDESPVEANENTIEENRRDELKKKEWNLDEREWGWWGGEQWEWSGFSRSRLGEQNMRECAHSRRHRITRQRGKRWTSWGYHHHHRYHRGSAVLYPRKRNLGCSSHSMTKADWETNEIGPVSLMKQGKK